MDVQKLEQMLAVIQERDINIHSFLIIRNGYLVSETYFDGYDQDKKHDIQSVGRSLTATLIGIAIDQGYIDGVDHRILDFFPERTVANPDERKQAMTLEDFLTMRTGFQWQEVEGAFESMRESPDWTQYILDMPMAESPGTRWNYCSICSHLFSGILAKTTGMNPYDFAEQNLFEPLGISDVVWIKDPAGLPLGAGGFELTPRDMAKLGYLYLRHGEWDGQQIVSFEWVEKATYSHVDVTMNEHLGYGYHWITVPSMEGYAALGGGGQTILVVPKHDLVIVTTAWTEESIFELIEQYILPSVRDSD
jgi:CubicO group peptidase (beta-lactamase class C family)